MLAAYVTAVAIGVLALVAIQPNVQVADDITPRPLLNGLDPRFIAVQGVALPGVLLISRLTRYAAASVLISGALIAFDVSAFAGQFLTIGGPGLDLEARETLTPLHAGRVLSFCQQSITPNSMIGLQVPTVDGYNSAFLRRYSDFALLVQDAEIGQSRPAFPKIGTAGAPRRPRLLDALNVTHFHSCAQLDDRFPVVETTPTWKVYANPTALPRAYLVCDVDRVSVNRAARTMKDNKFDPSRLAFVTPGDPGVGALPGAQQAVRGEWRRRGSSTRHTSWRSHGECSIPEL